MLLEPSKTVVRVVPEGVVGADVVCVCGGGGVSANVRQHAHMSDVLGWHAMLLVYVYLAFSYAVSRTCISRVSSVRCVRVIARLSRL